jgi:type I restriction-modification system DNA methylase subunit
LANNGVDVEKQNKKSRALNLTEERIEAILSIIDSWTQGRLTWDALIQLIEAATGVKYTRQALAKHQRIQMAYNIRNESLSNRLSAKNESGVRSLDEANRIIDQQKAEIARLKKAETLLLEQFARWAANAYTHNLDYRRLDEPLLPADRDSSVHEKTKLKSVKTV